MFKVDEVEKSQGFGTIPDGVYRVVLTEANHVSDEKSTRFEFTFTHGDGPYRNRKHWARHMYIPGPTTKPETLKAQKSQLADLFFVAGVKGFENEDEAYQICANITGTELYIKLRSSEWQGKTFQNVDDYWKLDGSNRSGKKLPEQGAQKQASSFSVPQENSDVPF